MADNSRTARLIGHLDKAGSLVEKWTGFVCVLFFGVLIVCMFSGVFFRYVLKDPIQWSEELSRFLMLWAGFGAMNIAMRRNDHIAIDVLLRRLPSWLSKILSYLTIVLIGVFLIVLMLKGYAMASRTTIMGSLVPVSMKWIYASVPVGALLTLVQLILNLMMKVMAEFKPTSTIYPRAIR